MDIFAALKHVESQKKQDSASKYTRLVDTISNGAEPDQDEVLIVLYENELTVGNLQQDVEKATARKALVKTMEAGAVAAAEVPTLEAEYQTVELERAAAMKAFDERSSPIFWQIKAKKSVVSAANDARQQLIKTAGDSHRGELVAIQNEAKLADRQIQPVKEDLQKIQIREQQLEIELANFRGEQLVEKQQALTAHRAKTEELRQRYLELRRILDTSNDRYKLAEEKLLSPMAI